ncbi:MAG: CotH kinase family protein [Oscillospiraceae bacterium]|nr:CotH kinase family protein [Oscillospiraceae bacterium]
MPRITRLLLLACILLTGCSINPTSPEQQDSSALNTPDSKADNLSDNNSNDKMSYPEWMDKLPVVRIETIAQGADALDFVTKPVARHVAEAIASWTPGYKIPPEPSYEDCRVTFFDGTTKAGTEPADAQVKVRGNWTTEYDKKPLRIKFAEKQNMAGLNDCAEQKNWLLLAAYKDASLLRDRAALAMARGLLEPDGLYCSDARLVEVEINGEYWGVYLLAEQQQIGENRVNITEAEKDYQGTDIGYFLEFDGYYVNEEPLQAFHVDYADNAPLTPFDGKGGSGDTITALPETPYDPKKDIGMTIKNDIYSQAQHDFIAGFVNNVYRIMYHAAYDDQAYKFNDDYSKITPADNMTPQQAVEAVVNVDSLADMYIISEMTCDADIYWSSFFLSADFGADGDRKLTFQAPWDFDSGLGNKNRCTNGKGFYAGNIVPDVNSNEYETVNPWLAVLMYQDWYQDIIRKKWTKAYDSGVFSDAVNLVRNETAEYEDAFQRNTDKWGISTRDQSIMNELSRSAKHCLTQASSAEYVAEWLENRTAFVNEQWHK